MSKKSREYVKKKCHEDNKENKGMTGAIERSRVSVFEFRLSSEGLVWSWVGLVLCLAGFVLS